MGRVAQFMCGSLPLTFARSKAPSSTISDAVWDLRFFFFFQAEDGIRDHCVTGVQTCALPISRSVAERLDFGARERGGNEEEIAALELAAAALDGAIVHPKNGEASPVARARGGELPFFAAEKIPQHQQLAARRGGPGREVVGGDRL